MECGWPSRSLAGAALRLKETNANAVDWTVGSGPGTEKLMIASDAGNLMYEAKTLTVTAADKWPEIHLNSARGHERFRRRSPSRRILEEARVCGEAASAGRRLASNRQGVLSGAISDFMRQGHDDPVFLRRHMQDVGAHTCCIAGRHSAAHRRVVPSRGGIGLGATGPLACGRFGAARFSRIGKDPHVKIGLCGRRRRVMVWRRPWACLRAKRYISSPANASAEEANGPV